MGRHRFRSEGRLLGSAILVGIVAGLGAVVFAACCHFVAWLALDQVAGYRPMGPVGEARLGWLADSARSFQPWWLVVVPAAGGLLSGYIVFKFAPEAEGHGTDAAIAAYHHGQGRIRPRVPVVKRISSAITIGTGGSGGREGPIAQIGAGFGSLLATDLMRDDVLPLQPDHGLDRALELFVRNNLQALPVVQDATDRRVVGIVRRSDIASAYVRRVHGEPW